MSEKSETLNLQIHTEENQEKIRIDKYLTDYLKVNYQKEFSRSFIQNLIKNEYVLIDEQKVNNKTLIAPNQIITVDLKDNQNQNNQKWKANAVDICLDVVYEDDDLLVINKPAGLVVHPGAGHFNDTLINELLHRYPQLDTVPRNGVIHRIDKDTSGLLCVTKNNESHQNLTMQMNNREIKKIYLALVNGKVISGRLINLPLSRSKNNRLKQEVNQNGKEALSEFIVEKRFDVHSLLKVNLITGRTHQIRVHLSYIGYPILGDKLYNPRKQNFIPKNSSDELIQAIQSFKRQALHAYCLELTHPKTKKQMQFKAPMPQDLNNLINLLT